MTSTAKSVITSDNDAVVTEIEIAAPPARVFRALIEREQALQWGGGEAFEITEWEMDARPGGQLASHFQRAQRSWRRQNYRTSW